MTNDGARAGVPAPAAPDLLGWELEEARGELAGKGLTVTVRKTVPPAGSEAKGPWRVVRQRTRGGEVELLVAREEGEAPRG